MPPPLHEQTCTPCKTSDRSRLERAIVTQIERQKLAAQVAEWNLSVDGRSISREFLFKDFTDALAFINRVGELAEENVHHPDIHWWWNKVKLVLTTHAIGGLSRNDFILAAKINRL